MSKGYDAEADENYGATVHVGTTRKQIRVWWETRQGETIDQRLYPRTAKGLASAERTIQRRIDEGYLFPHEDSELRGVLA
jgi:hypothetical protein